MVEVFLFGKIRNKHKEDKEKKQNNNAKLYI